MIVPNDTQRLEPPFDPQTGVADSQPPGGASFPVESVIDLVNEVLKESFANLFTQWRNAAQKPIEEGVEAVHQLRISTRRVTAALNQFANFLPRKKAARLARDLAVIRKSAGPARDCDVFAERLAKRCPELTSTALTQRWRRRRNKAHQSVAAQYVKFGRGERLERRAANLLAGICPRGRRARQLVLRPANWAARQLRRSIREFFSQCDIDTRDIEQLHALRIRVKQFRYGLEVVRPVLAERDMGTTLKSFKKLAKRLGQINDHAATIENLSSLLARSIDEPTRIALRDWRKEERIALQIALTEFAEWWTPRRHRRLRRKVLLAAAGRDPLPRADS